MLLDVDHRDLVNNIEQRMQISCTQHKNVCLSSQVNCSQSTVDLAFACQWQSVIRNAAKEPDHEVATMTLKQQRQPEQQKQLLARARLLHLLQSDTRH